MKRVTLYWDDDGSLRLFYHNGNKWRFRSPKVKWRDAKLQDWSPDDFNRSLVVNNFKEK